MMNIMTVGKQYKDAEGEWEVVGIYGNTGNGPYAIDEGKVEVECIQEGNINYGKRFIVDENEAIIGYYGWDYIGAMMDDEIREELHLEMAPCTELEFLEAYEKRHLEKYGEEFTVE